MILTKYSLAIPFLYFRMNGHASTVSSILEEVEHVISGIDYNDADADDDVLVFDEFGQSQRGQPVLIVSGSTDAGSTDEHQQSPGIDYVCNDDDCDTTMAIIATKRRTWRKPEDKPKRPLSAYNLFFQLERERLVSGDPEKNVLLEDISAVCDQHKQKKAKRKHRKTHGKIGFADLARTIAARWRNLKPQTKSMYEGCASTEKARYQKEVAVWVKAQAAKAKEAVKEIANQKSPDEDKTMPPNTVIMPSNTVLKPPPDSPMKAREQSMVDTTYQHAPSLSTSESLHKLMANGRSYTHYQSLVEQQRKMIEVEITQNRRMVQDTQRQIILASFAAPGPANSTPYQGLHASTPYPGQAPSAHYPATSPSYFPGQGNLSSFQGQGNRPPSFSTSIPPYGDHHNSGPPGDYYGLADQAYQMVQRTLRPPTQPVNPPFHMGMGTGGIGMGGVGMGMGMGMGMIGGSNRLFQTDNSFEPLGQVNDIAPRPQQAQEEEEEVMLDPRTDLSSPTFDSTGREEQENPRIELARLLDSFENA
jgi:hypothetical protein